MSYNDAKHLMGDAFLVTGGAMVVGSTLFGIISDADKTKQTWIFAVLLIGFFLMVFGSLLSAEAKKQGNREVVAGINAVRESLRAAGYYLDERDMLFSNDEGDYDFLPACGELQLELVAAESDSQWRIYQDLWNGERLLIPPERLNWLRVSLSEQSDKFIHLLRQGAVTEVEPKKPRALWFERDE